MVEDRAIEIQKDQIKKLDGGTQNLIKLTKCVVMILLLVACSGCITAIPYLVRRSVVHDDVVLVRENNTLYRRYIPCGVRLRPNKELLEIAGSITMNNDKVIAFSNYEAVDSDSGFILHESIESIK